MSAETNAESLQKENEQLHARVAELERLVAEWVALDSQWDVQRVGKLCGVALGQDIRQAIETAPVRLTSEVAELEAQAAFGRRAVEWPIADAEEQRLGWKLSYNFLWQIEKAVSKAGYTSSQEAVELTLLTAYAILRDAEQAAPEPATVAADAGALAELREAVGYLDKQPVYLLSISRARAEVLVMEAARRLLAGGE